jgi:hypothetical protein
MIRRWTFAAVAFLLGLLAVHDVLKNQGMRPENQLTDLRAFYCAAQANNEDPYRVEPLRACEHAISRQATEFNDPAFVLPAPVPGYTIGAMRLIAWAPFPPAAAVFSLAQLAAAVAAVAGLARLGARPLLLNAAALGFAGFFLCIFHGQLMTFEIALLVLAALLLQKRRWAAAGLACAATLIEPHIGAPVCLAVFCAAPRSRFAIAGGGIALAAVSIAAIGLPANVEYLTSVMSAQVHAELSYQEQYSLTYALQFLGVPAQTALALGSASYALTAALGVAAACRFAQAESLELAPLAAAALSVAGSPYAHVTQMAAAIPLALVLRSRTRGTLVRGLASAALLLLCVPWPLPYESKALYLVAGFVIAAVAWCVTDRSLPRTAAITAVFLVMLNVLENRPRVTNVDTPLRGIGATELASVAWAQAAAQRETRDLPYFAVKVLTWSGLACTLGALAGALRETRRVRRTSRA